MKPVAFDGGFWTLLAVLAGGAALRFYGLDYGLPYVYMSDELIFIGLALDMISTGDLNPHWFGHPGTTMMYLCAAIFSAMPAVGSDHIVETFYAARLTAYFFGVASIWIVYIIGHRIADRPTGLVAAAMLAAAPLHAQFSWIARPDAQMTFLILICTLFILQIVFAGRWRDYLLSGFLLGLAVATKYPSLVLAIVIIWAHFLYVMKERQSIWSNFSRLLSAGMATIFGAFVGSPYMFIDFSTTLSDLQGEATPFIMSATSGDFLQSLNWYLGGPIATNIGIVGMIMALVGAGSIIYRRNSGGSVILLFATGFVVFISSLNLLWPRWAIPALPFIGLLAAIGLGEVFGRFRADRTTDLLRRSGYVIVGLAILAGPVITSIDWTRGVVGGDTRTIASEWILNNVPRGSAIIAEESAPQLPKDAYQYYGLRNGRVAPVDPYSQHFYMELPNFVPHGALGEVQGVDSIERAGIDYVVLSNHYDRRLAESLHKGLELQYVEIQIELENYREMMRRYELVFETSPVPGKLTGTKVRIYRVSGDQTG